MYHILLIFVSCFLSSCASDNQHKQATLPNYESRTGLYSDQGGKFPDLPKSHYKIYEVNSIGSFYLDNRIDIIKNHLRSGQVWEPEIVALLKEHIRTGSTAVDIGSHIGTHTITMSTCVGNKGKVVAFEPQEKLFSELVNNVRLNKASNVQCYRCAVGKDMAEIEMNPAVIDNEGGTKIGIGGDKAKMIPLDSLALENVSLIKIDVENLELDVLRGAEQTILKNKPTIIVEIMGNTYEPIPNRNAKVESTLQYLKSLGYDTRYIANSWSDWLAIPSGIPN